jgi:hypothetical protein
VPWGAGEPVTPVTVALSFSVPAAPRVVEPVVVEALVVVVVVAGVMWTHSVPSTVAMLSVEPE